MGFGRGVCLGRGGRAVKVDAFTHVAPPGFRDRALRLATSASDFQNWPSIPGLSDIALRIELMDEARIDMQVICTPSPPLDEQFDQRTAQDLARQANDEVAAIVADHPDRFIGAATLSLTDPSCAVEELRRAVEDLGLRGALLYTSVNGGPIDGPDFRPLYDALEALDVPAWLHPERSSGQPDYPTETTSKYGLFLVFGWPYETTLAMARLVFSGTMQRHPGLKIIAHHAGAMIPRFANRIQSHYQNLPRVDRPDALESPPIDYFKRFWVDSVTQGSVSALMNAREVFGAERMVFASDFPFGTNGGRDFITSEMAALAKMPISSEEKERIWGQNLMELCGIATNAQTARPLT
jgi:predicted TIM-barrel fold metal-dependent hydrolase